MNRSNLPALTLAAAALALAGCASQTSAPASSAPASSAAKAPAKAQGAIIGTPAPDSRFAKLKIGMHSSEVQSLMNGTPDRWHTYESGKRWIPFYFGNDARRMQALYKAEGCLIFADGNIWGAAGGDLMEITVDPSGACYQP